MSKQGEASAQYSSLSSDSPLLSPRNLNYGQDSALTQDEKLFEN